MPQRQTRNVSLTPELENFIDDTLAAGEHASASEIVRAALTLLRERAAAVPPEPAAWPIGGGECGALIRAHDWSRSSIGAIAGWSGTLRTTISNIVHSPVPKVLMWGGDHVMVYNDAYREIAGRNHPAALGGTVPAVWPEIWDFNRDVLGRAMAGEVIGFRDKDLRVLRNGLPEQAVFDLWFTPIYEADGRVGGVMCTVVETTERRAAEQATARREAELRAVTDALPVLVGRLDRDLRYRFANAAYEDWYGRPAVELVGLPLVEIIGPEALAARRPMLERALAGEPVVFEDFTRRQDGERRRCEIRYLPCTDANGVVDAIQVLAIDVEDRIRHAAALEASNGRFRTAMDAVHGVLWTNSPDGRMVGEQPGWAALTGQSFAEYQGFGWADAVHPDDRAASVDRWNRAVAARAMFVHEHRVRHHAGRWRCFSIRALPILGVAGEIVEWVGVHTDITHQRAAEQALREHVENLARQVRHRERAEEQLRQLNETLETRVVAESEERRVAEARLLQAQKLETIGKLTGGVAHDFNNLLQVISGNLQLLGTDIAGNERAERRLANAVAGVGRGAKLAAQLLAFGRRQALEPKVVDVSRFVGGMDDMLRRAIGEAIEVETVIGGGLWNCLIDPTQIENALLNLAINARDAMNGAGKLTIELANAHLDDDYVRRHDDVTAGQYVMLAVTDTGSGMSPDVLARVFEPFFSTKAEGKGSGLGLSMVYGFVKQSGGHVKIYSEPGYGTTIRLYLPRADAAEDRTVAISAGPLVGGTETVLVVEDDPAVRATVIEMLGELGYRVLKAVDGASALNVIESGMPIDLLFTDVVMPGAIKGAELGRRARERMPGMAVLFTSGYTENSIVHGGRLDAGLELLSKPYTREQLARKLRHVIGNHRQAAADRGAREHATPGVPAAATAATGRRRGTVLLIEDNELIRAGTAELLASEGFEVLEAGDGDAALALLGSHAVDVLVTDINLPGLSGPEIAVEARRRVPALGVVFASGEAAPLLRGELADAVALEKPYHLDALRDAIDVARRAAAATGADVARHEASA